MRITVERAERGDIPEIARIARECASSWSEEQLFEELDFDFARLDCARIEGRIVGFIDYHLTPDNAHINEIAVDKAHRKLGAGRALLKRAEKTAAECGCSELTLEVSESNTEALGLYDKESFYQIAVRRRFYGDGDGKVLKKEL